MADWVQVGHGAFCNLDYATDFQEEEGGEWMIYLALMANEDDANQATTLVETEYAEGIKNHILNKISREKARVNG